MNEHTFVWDGGVVGLVYSLVMEQGERRFVLEDVVGPSLALANALPDWRIEAEAAAVAAERGASYL